MDGKYWLLFLANCTTSTRVTRVAFDQYGKKYVQEMLTLFAGHNVIRL